MSRALSAFREGSRAREAFRVLLVVAAAVTSALSFRAAVHPEEIHRPRHHEEFARHADDLPALGAMRVRLEGAGDPAASIQRLQGLGTVRGLTPVVLGLFRRARYLGASPEVVADAIAKLNRGEAPVPPAPPDLTRYYSDARGPYACDLVPSPGVQPAAVRETVPDARLSGEPVAREAEEREAAAIVRTLLLGLAVLAAWLALRQGVREAQHRLLAALGVLVASGILGVSVDRWSVVALLLVAGAPGGAALLAGAACLPFPIPALHRMGLFLCLGGALRLLFRRPALPAMPPRRAMAQGAALAVALGAAGFVALARAPLRVASPPAVEAEPGALLVPRDAIAKAAASLRAEGIEVTGDESLLPPPPDAARRRGLWRIFSRAQILAGRAEGEERARFEDAADAASEMSFPTLPRDLRWRLLARDGRAVLWTPSDADREDLRSARLYRERGERELRERARLAGALVAVLGGIALSVAGGGVLAVLLRLLGAAAGVGLLLLARPGEADLHVPLVALAAAAPAAGPALALAAASLVQPALLWPAAALLVASAVNRRSPRSPTRPSP